MSDMPEGKCIVTLNGRAYEVATTSISFQHDVESPFTDIEIEGVVEGAKQESDKSPIEVYFDSLSDDQKRELICKYL